MAIKVSKLFTLSFLALTVSFSSFGKAKESSTSVNITAEVARSLENTAWTGISGVYLSETSNKGIQNASSMVFAFSEGQLYYLSKINPLLDKLIDKGAGGLCVKSEPRRVEFFRDSKTGNVSGLVYVPRLDKKTGARSQARIKLEKVDLSQDGTSLKILDWEITTKKGKHVYIPTRYDLHKADLTNVADVDLTNKKVKATAEQVAKVLRNQLDQCLKDKPWMK